MSSKHVFPLILDGAVQAVTEAKDWNGLTSYVTAEGAGGNFTFTLGSAEHAGTIVTVIKIDATNIVTVNPTSDFDSSAGSVQLNLNKESVSFMWDGSKWRLFQQDQSSSFNGGAVANATTFNGNVEVEGNVGFYNTAPIAQRASADQAVVAAGSGLPADGTGAGVNYTQAEITGAFDTIYDLITLVNQLRADLVALGLIKGSA